VLLVLLFHNAQGFIQGGDLGFTGADLARQNWIEFAVWSAVALVLIAGDRKVWRAAPAAAVYPEPRAAGTETPTVRAPAPA
jgi:hypothetical protein